MAQAHTVDAIEHGARHVLSEIRATAEQIDGGEWPQYDDNCRDYLRWLLNSLATDRERQAEMGTVFDPVDAGLRMDHVPGEVTMGEVSRWRRWVKL